MRFFDKLLNRSGQNVDREAAKSEARIEREPTLGEQVWTAPALHNRHTRRAYGILSKVWHWDLNASDETRRVFVPRYLRRHGLRVVATQGKHRTRRVRKEAARVARAIRFPGMKRRAGRLLWHMPDWAYVAIGRRGRRLVNRWMWSNDFDGRVLLRWSESLLPWRRR